MDSTESPSGRVIDFALARARLRLLPSAAELEAVRAGLLDLVGPVTVSVAYEEATGLPALRLLEGEG